MLVPSRLAFLHMLSLVLFDPAVYMHRSGLTRAGIAAL